MAGDGRSLILTYHAIEPGPGPLFIEPSLFRAHLAVIAESGVEVVTLDRIAEQAQNGDLRPSTVAISIDDGFASVADHAAPLLVEAGVPATFFCVAGRLGGFNDFRGQRPGVPRRPLAGAAALADLVAERIEIGSHGMAHAPLSLVDESTARREVVDSRRVLEDAIGAPVRWFGYPYGAVPGRSTQALVERTYAGACVGENRPVRAGSDRFALPRFDAHYLRRPALLRRALQGWDPYLLLRRGGGRIRRSLRPDFMTLSASPSSTGPNPGPAE